MKNVLIYFYTIFLLFFCVFSYVFIDPNLIYLKNLYSGFAFSNRLFTVISYMLFVVIFFIFYGIFVWLGVKKRLNFKDIFILLGITAGILLFSYPAMLSYDIFNYIATSKVLFFYQENPYVVMPFEFVGDSLLSFTHASNKIALYGPLWIFLTGIPYFLGFGNFIITLFSFKFFIAIFYLGTIFLIWKMSKNVIPVILFSLNPLVVIETLVSGHNDTVMIFFVMLSFFLLRKKKVFYTISFFVFSILIKYATIMLIPIFLYVLWKIAEKKEINWKTIFFNSSLFMLVGFLLSPIREEIYPWYAIWFLPFVFLALNRKIVLVSIVFSFGLLLRYIPYILTGTYAGQTPILKEIISFGFPVLYCLFYVLKKKV